MKCLVFILYVFLVAFLIFTRMTSKYKMSLIAKTCLSILLLMLTINIAFRGKELKMWILFSIMFSSIADIFLGINKIEEKSQYLFYIALIIVTFAQISLFISSIQLSRFNFYSIPTAIAMNIILYYSFSRVCEMSKMQKYSMLYSYIFLLVIANTFLNIKVLQIKDIKYVIAVTLYWISDIILFIQKFISKKKIFDGINKVLYYTAQLTFVLYLLE